MMTDHHHLTPDGAVWPSFLQRKMLRTLYKKKSYTAIPKRCPLLLLLLFLSRIALEERISIYKVINTEKRALVSVRGMILPPVRLLYSSHLAGGSGLRAEHDLFA